MARHVGEALSGLVEGLVSTGGGRPRSLLEHGEAIVAAVRWGEERWLHALLAAHVLLWALAVAGRRVWWVQAAVLATATAAVLGGRWLNDAAAVRWQSFSSQNYFDEQGLFVSLVLGVPCVLLGLGMLAYNFYRASQLLITVKRMELLRTQKQKRG